MIAAANRVYHEFLASEDGSGFSGQVRNPFYRNQVDLAPICRFGCPSRSPFLLLDRIFCQSANYSSGNMDISMGAQKLFSSTIIIVTIALPPSLNVICSGVFDRGLSGQYPLLWRSLSEGAKLQSWRWLVVNVDGRCDEQARGAAGSATTCSELPPLSSCPTTLLPPPCSRRGMGSSLRCRQIFPG